MVTISKEVGAKYATVVIPSNPKACYMAMYYGDLKEGDLVVGSHYPCYKDDYCVRKVVTSNIPPAVVDYIEYVIYGKVDTSAYDNHKQKAKRKRELSALIRERVNKITEEDRWNAMLERDPELKKMYNEYEELSKE